MCTQTPPQIMDNFGVLTSNESWLTTSGPHQRHNVRTRKFSKVSLFKCYYMCTCKVQFLKLLQPGLESHYKYINMTPLNRIIRGVRKNVQANLWRNFMTYKYRKFGSKANLISEESTMCHTGSSSYKNSGGPDGILQII